MRSGRGIRVRLKGLKIVRRPGGATAVYFRAPGGALTRLPDLPLDAPDFLAAYARARAASGAPADTRPGPRSLAALADLYVRRLAKAELAESTRADRRRIAFRIADGERARVSVAAIAPRHIEADLAPLTPQVARNRLKVWRGLMALAKAERWRADDPSRAVTPPRARAKPHPAWSEADVAAFRARWPHCTQQRLAFELLYWLGCRLSDVVQLGPRHAWAGWMRWPQAKTGRLVELPIAAELAAALAHARPGAETYLETAQGRARSPKGFGAWWAEACTAAGVAARAHGLRHTMGADLAEGGAEMQGVSAVLGHASLTQSATYVQQANRRRLAEAAVRKVEAKRTKKG